ncbi:hypothetical protein Lalb_Chr08g0232131 [Lupinus albus]|uniref:Uncharacterized protein n=1 Tax=Lupinus albus TaxID=3870 RepID=A0A6A4Q2W2_LUPAL|nr:hypothetical protein Lalb_Chr08g0232131 [Lupinus albus]
MIATSLWGLVCFHDRFVWKMMFGGIWLMFGFFGFGILALVRVVYGLGVWKSLEIG